MSAVLNFDASQVVPDSGVQDAIPAGWYNVIIDQSELKPTKNQDGQYLEVRHNIIDGAQVGKKVYGRLNLRNPNPTAQEIGYKQLSAICHAVGILQVSDSAQLHNIPMKIKVKLRPAKDEYEASNDIVSWKNINEVVTMATAVAAGFPTLAPAAPTVPGFTMPPAAQPPAYAPPPQAPAQQPQPQWQPPAAQQPWPQGGAPVAPVAPQPPVYAAPVAPQPPAPPVYQQPAPAAPVYAEPPQQPQQPQQPQPQQPPAAPVYQAPPQPQQPPAVAPAPQPGVAPAWNGAQTATPPWMTPPPAQQG